MCFLAVVSKLGRGLLEFLSKGFTLSVNLLGKGFVGFGPDPVSGLEPLGGGLFDLLGERGGFFFGFFKHFLGPFDRALQPLMTFGKKLEKRAENQAVEDQKWQQEKRQNDKIGDVQVQRHGAGVDSELGSWSQGVLCSPGRMASEIPIAEHDLAQHIPNIRRYLTKILRPDELEDGTQTVLERALRNLDRFEGQSSPRSWLLGIARNVGFEIARARTRGPRPSEDATSGDLPAHEQANQEEQLGRKEQQALALSALGELSLDEKLALLVTYVDGLSGPEAAEILGVSFAAFRQRLSRARNALASRLERAMTGRKAGSAEVMAEWRKLLDPWHDRERPPPPRQTEPVAGGTCDKPS